MSPTYPVTAVQVIGEVVSVMSGVDRARIVRESYRAFAAGDRAFFEEHLAKEFTFSAPPDPLLDRDGWFERCWPGAGNGREASIVRLVESGDEVIITYESDGGDGTRGRNTEVLTVDTAGQIVRTEVYFGWTVGG